VTEVEFIKIKELVQGLIVRESVRGKNKSIIIDGSVDEVQSIKVKEYNLINGSQDEVRSMSATSKIFTINGR
jgi:hypothetical protein